MAHALSVTYVHIASCIPARRMMRELALSSVLRNAENDQTGGRSDLDGTDALSLRTTEADNGAETIK